MQKYRGIENPVKIPALRKFKVFSFFFVQKLAILRSTQHTYHWLGVRLSYKTSRKLSLKSLPKGRVLIGNSRKVVRQSPDRESFPGYAACFKKSRSISTDNE
jgi:hypothetical protein